MLQHEIFPWLESQLKPLGIRLTGRLECRSKLIIRNAFEGYPENHRIDLEGVTGIVAKVTSEYLASTLAATISS